MGWNGMGPGSVVPEPPPGFRLIADPAQIPPPPPGFTLVQPGQAAQSAQPAQPPSSPGRALQVGLQGAGRGMADLAGMPVDIATLIANGLLFAGPEAAANLFLSDEQEISLPRITDPVGGGDWIADLFGSGAETLGADLLDYEDMSGSERLAYNVNRFGGQAAVGGAGLAGAAAARGASAAPRPFDTFLSPYVGSKVGATLAADTAGGAGSGAALTWAEDATDNEFLQLMAMLAGGAAGAGAGALATRPRDAVNFAKGFLPDPDIPYAPGSMVPTSRRVADMAAQVVQPQASNPRAAARELGEHASLARMYGDPTATSGIASGDLGLIGLEKGMRQAGSPDNPSLRRQFLESDQRVKEAAADRVFGLRDPGADQAAGLQFAQDRPAQLRAERDAEAIPILREAEASGAEIDTSGVIEAIEGTLGTAKRPAVRDAMVRARQMLNQPGTEEIDTSVSGLYETRKAINDLIEGRTETPTGQFARRELLAVRDALDEAIGSQVPEYRRYLDTYREGSRPLDVFEESRTVSRMVGEERDLRNVAKRLLTGDEYGRDQAMQEVRSVMQADPEAARAWRASVAEVLADRVSRTAREGELSIAQVRRVWDQHRDTLAQVFSPEDMQTLERTHQMLAPLENLSRQAVPGSSTVDNQQILRSMDAAILAATGNAITAGMIMTRITRAVNLFGLKKHSTGYKVERLVERMMFDPDLARHILERPVEDGAGAAWNARLRDLIASSELSRDLYSEDDEMMEAIDGPR